MIEFSPTHAGEEDVEDEESPNSCEEDASSEFSDSDDSSTYVEESFEVMFFVPEKEIQQGMRESMEGDVF